jgi:hypothetical protein
MPAGTADRRSAFDRASIFGSAIATRVQTANQIRIPPNPADSTELG